MEWPGISATTDVGGAGTPDPKRILATEVFEAITGRSSRARFLGLMSVMEILAQPRPRSLAAVDLVDETLVMLGRSGADLTEADTDSLRTSLVALRMQPIGRSIRRLIVGLGPTQVRTSHRGDIGQFVDRCLAARSRLISEGAPMTGDLHEMTTDLHRLVHHLLTRPRSQEIAAVSGTTHEVDDGRVDDDHQVGDLV